MKKMPLFSLAIFSASIILAGCSPIMPASDRAQIHPVKKNPAIIKDPVHVTLAGQNEPAMPYVIIGEATVSKYNIAGNRRQKAVIHDRLRDIAASMGGDAVIHIKSRGKYITGTVIVFQHLPRI